MGPQSHPIENELGKLSLMKPMIQVINEKKILVNIGIKNFCPANLDTQSANFTDYIDFWEIDPDYNGEYFNSQYQVIRKKQRYKETIAVDIVFPAALGKAIKVALKVWDVWANQTMEVVTI
jgi:hypothetical protein